MTAEPIAELVADIRAGRAQHPSDDRPLNRTLSDRARRPQPVVDCTAIFAAQQARDEIALYEDHPQITPPWENALLCYVNTFNNVIAMQVHRYDFDGPAPDQDEWFTHNEVDWSSVRWIAETTIWIGGRAGDGSYMPTTGPCHMFRHAINGDGSPADINWLALLLPGGRRAERQELADPMQGVWDSALITLGAALNFLGASNVEVAEPQRSRPERRRLARTGVTVQAIVVRPPGKRRAASSAPRPIEAGEQLFSPVRGHFACVDEETEILSRRGWLRHFELLEGDEVAGYDLDSGVARWTTCHGVHRYAYDGQMVSAEARGLSMLLTPNHRALAVRARRVRRAPEVITASELRPKHAIPRSLSSWCDDGREKGIGVELARLCAWVAAEGSVRQAGGRVSLCQSSVANPNHVAAIDEMLAAVDFPPPTRPARTRPDLRTDQLHRRVEATGMVRWTLPLGLSQELLRIMPGKLLPAWFANLPLNEAEAVLEAFIDGDGHRRPAPRGAAITQKRRECLDVLQSIAVRLGWNTSLRHDPQAVSSAVWSLTLTTGRPAQLRRSDSQSLLTARHHRGLVWCPTTGTGTFVARRNGHVFVTGNSYGPEFDRGLLFGKYSGKFWVPAHARGQADGGQRDYVLRPGAAA